MNLISNLIIIVQYHCTDNWLVYDPCLSPLLYLYTDFGLANRFQSHNSRLRSLRFLGCFSTESRFLVIKMKSIWLILEMKGWLVTLVVGWWPPWIHHMSLLNLHLYLIGVMRWAMLYSLRCHDFCRSITNIYLSSSYILQWLNENKDYKNVVSL